jgi:flagellar protein FlaF
VTAQSMVAHAAYSRPNYSQRSERDLEYDLLARATKSLSQAMCARSSNFPKLYAALDENERLWSTLAVDVAEPGNGLPAALRAQLFYLYEFTVQHSAAVRERDASVQVLIDINTAVMRGLRGQGAQT